MKPLSSKTLLSMPKRQKQLGLLMMTVGLAGCIGTMSYFGLFGKRIEYTANCIFKITTAFSFLVFGLYGAGYAYGGKRLGLSFAKRWAIFLIGAGALGYLVREFR